MHKKHFVVEHRSTVQLVNIFPFYIVLLHNDVKVDTVIKECGYCRISSVFHHPLHLCLIHGLNVWLHTNFKTIEKFSSVINIWWNIDYFGEILEYWFPSFHVYWHTSRSHCCLVIFMPLLAQKNLEALLCLMACGLVSFLLHSRGFLRSGVWAGHDRVLAWWSSIHTFIGLTVF